MYKNIATHRLGNDLFKAKGLIADVLRLDLMHPQVSGNKWFKLKHHLASAIADGKKGIVSFGGAFSNHLVALAYVCRQQGLACTGIIRGNEPQVYSPSLLQMQEFGMQLLFVSREEYRSQDMLADEFLASHPDYYLVPEGGGGPEGIAGASEILQHCREPYSHIICAAATGTTLTGLINASSPGQHLIGVACIKVADPENNQLSAFTRHHSNKDNYKIFFGYHFGGYAKKTPELIAFMNRLFQDEKIPTDFVYTGKLLYAVHDLAAKGHFPAGSRLVIIHSGGLQGNRSLPRGLLCF